MLTVLTALYAWEDPAAATTFAMTPHVMVILIAPAMMIHACATVNVVVVVIVTGPRDASRIKYATKFCNIR
jgi:hypothetical protein